MAMAAFVTSNPSQVGLFHFIPAQYSTVVRTVHQRDHLQQITVHSCPCHVLQMTYDLLFFSSARQILAPQREARPPAPPLCKIIQKYSH